METSNKKKISKLSVFVDGVKSYLGILIALVAMCVLLSIFSSAFLTTRNIFNVLRQIAVNVFLSCGMTMVLILGGIDLSIGSIIALSGCLTATMIAKMSIHPLIAILCGILIGLIVGIANGFVISRTTIPPFIVTLASQNICRGLARVAVNNKTVSVSNSLYQFIGTGYIGGVPIHVIFIIVVIVITAILLSRTQFGRSIYAVGGNRMAATYSGINARKITMLVYIINGVLAGCAGILSSSRTMVGQYSLGEGAEMNAITAVVLGGTSMSGGVGSISGTIIGCLIVGVLNNGMNLLGIDSSWQYVVQGIVVLLAVYVDYLKKSNALSKIKKRRIEVK